MSSMGWGVSLFLILAFIWAWLRMRRLARADYIRQYTFPVGLLDKLSKHYPLLEKKDRQLVARGLRQFFLVYLNSGKLQVSMPSQATDALWHEFILYTKHYQLFCRKAFGHFMHHTPAVVLGRDRQSNRSLRRTWWYACKEENINPRKALRLPLLFALDAKLQIGDGFRYSLDCSRSRISDEDMVPYCAGEFVDNNDGYFGDDNGSFFDVIFDGDSDGDGGGDCGGDGCSAD